MELRQSSGGLLQGQCTSVSASRTTVYVGTTLAGYMFHAAGVPTTPGPTVTALADPNALSVDASGALGVVWYGGWVCGLLTVGRVAPAAAHVYSLPDCGVGYGNGGFVTIQLPPGPANSVVTGIAGLFDPFGEYVHGLCTCGCVVTVWEL